MSLTATAGRILCGAIRADTRKRCCGVTTPVPLLSVHLRPSNPLSTQIPLSADAATWIGLAETIDQDPSMAVSPVGMKQEAAADLGTIGFVDVCEELTVLVEGRPFAFVEGPGGTTTLTAPLSGEVVEVNQQVVSTPEVLTDNADASVNWIVKIEHSVD